MEIEIRNPQESKAAADMIRRPVLAQARYGAVTANRMLGSFLGNLVGPIPEDVWEEMLREIAKPCDDPKCDCHTVFSRVFDALDDLRTDWIAHVDDK